MFRPSRMAKVNVLVFSRYLGELTQRLGESGVIHLVNAADESRQKLLRKLDTGNDVRSITQMITRCDVLLDALGIELNDAPPASAPTLSQDEISELFEKIDRLYRQGADRVATLIARHTGLDQTSREVAGFPLQSLRVETLRNLSQLHIEAGSLDEESFVRARAALSEDAIFIQYPEEPGQVLVLTSRRRHFAVDDTLGKFGFKRIELPECLTSGTAAEKQAALRGELEELRREINQARLSIVALGEEYGGVLLAIRRQLRSLLTVREAQGMFGRARQLYCISGWVPMEALPRLQKLVDDTTAGTGIIEVSEADQALKEGTTDGSDVPVQLTDNTIVRPFRALVTNFGMPNYRELDPSFFVGITFLIMFGYMFGDLGQGAVLALTGTCVFLRKSFSRTIRDYGLLLLFCGISAMFFGLLYGSVFGNEELLKPLWVSPSPLHSDIPKLLISAVGIGVVFLSVSLIINIINHFRIRKFYDGTMDKCGFVGLFFYWACLFAAGRMVFTGSVSGWNLLLIAAPLLLIFLKGPIYNLIHHRSVGNEEDSAFNVLLEGVIEIMETLTGYLSGTISFVRVGAYAISHAALCLAIYSIMNMFNDLPGGTVVKLLISIGGNIIIIAFEGMVAAIQCIRLEYYELFSRYFQGGGVPYQPFKIKE